MHRLVPVAVLAPVMSAVLAMFSLTPAGAAVPLSGVVSQQPVSWTPNIFAGTTSSTVCQQWFGGTCSNARVTSTAIVNGEVIVAGAFTQVCQSGTSSGHCTSGTLVTRDDIFAYDLGTGTIDPNFKPQLDKGPVYSVAAGPSGTVYIGGAFTTVNGSPQRGVAQLNLVDGSAVKTFTGTVSNTVFSLAYQAGALYVGGQFTTVDSKTEDGIARLDANGNFDSTFGISISNPITVGGTALALKVAALSLSADGSKLAIAGTFTQVNGPPKPVSATRVALISTGGGLGSAASVANWSAPVLTNNCSAEHDYVRGIDISPDGSYLVIATTGSKSDGSISPSVCDVVARFPTAATAPVSPTWINYAGGDSFYSVQATGSVVYAGGHNRWANNQCGFNQFCEANAVLVMGFTAIDANTGLAVPWFQPLTTRGQGVMSLTAFPAGEFTASNGGVLLGDGVTTNGEGQFHSFNALFPLTDTTSSPTFGSIPSGLFLTGHPAGMKALCVDDPGSSSTSGTAVDMATCNNGTGQNWTVQPDGTIMITLNGTISGLCLDNPSGSSVRLNTCSTASSQKWTQTATNELKNNASGLCLDDPGSATTSGTMLDAVNCGSTVTSNLVWPLPTAPIPSSLTPAGPVSAQVPSATAQPACLNDGSAKSGSAVVTWTCFNNANQHATIQSNNTIQIHGLCLDTNGTNVVLNTCSGASSQIWTPGARHSLVNQLTGQCLNAPAQTNGTQLTVTTCSTTTNKNQEWLLPAV